MPRLSDLYQDEASGFIPSAPPSAFVSPVRGAIRLQEMMQGRPTYYAGGSPVSLADMVQVPKSKTELALSAAAALPVGKIAKMLKGTVLYRGAPTAELGKGNYPGTFLSLHPDAVADVAVEYGDVPVHRYSTGRDLKLFNAERAKASDLVVEQYLKKYPAEREYIGAGQDRSGDLAGLFEQPGTELRDFLKAKGYDGMRWGHEVFVFDADALVHSAK